MSPAVTLLFLLMFSSQLLLGGEPKCPPSSGQAANPRLQRFEFEFVAMAVPVKVVFFAEDDCDAKEAICNIEDRFNQLNEIFSDYLPDSEVKRLAASAGTNCWLPVSPELWELLNRSLWFSEQSEGAFDVTVGPVVRLWRRARRQRELPSVSALEQAKESVGYRFVSTNAETRSVLLNRPGMLLDFGGIAKGYAVDQSIELLRERGIRHAFVDAGGDIRLGEPPPGRSGWVIAIQPFEPTAQPEQFLILANCAVATSGDRFQHITINGERYSHLIDPRSGWAMRGRSMVTVVGPDCTTADALASAVSVLGPEAGLKLVDRIEGCAAEFIREAKNRESDSSSPRSNPGQLDGISRGYEVYRSARWSTLPLLKASELITSGAELLDVTRLGSENGGTPAKK